MISSRLAAIPLAVALLLLVGCAAEQSPSASPPAPPPVSALEAERLTQESLDFYWARVLEANPTADRPSIDVIRYVGREEYATTQVECLREKGFDAKVAEGNSVELVFFSPEHEANTVAAQYECAAAYPLDPVYKVPFSEEELRFIYDHWRGDLTECLEDHGVSVSDPPSLTTFVETYGQETAWDPFANIGQSAEITSSEVQNILASCPDYPSGLRENVSPTEQ